MHPSRAVPTPPGDTDRHVIVIDRDAWKLYEIHAGVPIKGGWQGSGGAIFDLANNTNRPAGWTSADAAGLPIFPGLVRYDEAVEAGAIRHALRFTAAKIRRAYVPPAKHWSTNDKAPSLPPMGMRVRLKWNTKTDGFPPVVRTILEGLKTYGMFLADIGSDWFISGAHDMRWDDDALGSLKKIKGRDFEVVKTGRMVVG